MMLTACLVMMVSSVTNIFVVKLGTSNDLNSLPCLPAFFWFSSYCPLQALALVEVDFLQTNLP
jgi:hypothetical protein